LEASSDLRPGNGAGLFAKEKMKKKVKEKEDKQGSTRCKQANDIYSTEINK